MADPQIPESAVFDDIIARAHELCFKIAGRDLAEAPLYIIRQSEIAGELGQAEACDGYTMPNLDLCLREHIGPAWEGCGPCLVVNDLILRDEVHADDLACTAYSIILHELAHILDRPTPVRDNYIADVEPARVKFESLVIATSSARPVERPIEIPRCFGHGDTFIRIALHLRHRAILEGANISPSRLCAGRTYGLSHAERYIQALGEKPRPLAGGPFEIIRQIPPPAEFTDLWNADVRRYHQNPVQKGSA